MSNKFRSIWGNKKSVIGAVHLPPLLGYPEFPGFKIAINNALRDLRTFERGGADAIIFENNYDYPHTISVGPEIIAAMIVIGQKLRAATKLPIGISVLWNDYRAALSIAKILDLQFIRLPVFVDTVKTNYGIVAGEPKKIIAYRAGIKAENIAVFTDIHVKHAKLLSHATLEESARQAIANGSDGLIITGRWTGDAPNLDNLKKTRLVVKKFPVLLGSGVDASNIKNLMRYADAAIVSTSLKKGAAQSGEVNVKKYSQRIDLKKVRALINALK